MRMAMAILFVGLCQLAFADPIWVFDEPDEWENIPSGTDSDTPFPCEGDFANRLGDVTPVLKFWLDTNPRNGQWIPESGGGSENTLTLTFTYAPDESIGQWHSSIHNEDQEWTESPIVFWFVYDDHKLTLSYQGDDKATVQYLGVE